MVLAPRPEIDSRRRLSAQLECQLLQSFSRLKHPGSVAKQGRHEMSKDLIEYPGFRTRARHEER
jgi:hypothetical protein